MATVKVNQGRGVLVSAEIQDADNALANDPIIQAMARELPGDADIQHPDGTPRLAFCNAAAAEYVRRGGTLEVRTIGSAGRAIVANR